MGNVTRVWAIPTFIVKWPKENLVYEKRDEVRLEETTSEGMLKYEWRIVIGLLGAPTDTYLLTMCKVKKQRFVRKKLSIDLNWGRKHDCRLRQRKLQ